MKCKYCGLIYKESTCEWCETCQICGNELTYHDKHYSMCRDCYHKSLTPKKKCLL